MRSVRRGQCAGVSAPGRIRTFVTGFVDRYSVRLSYQRDFFCSLSFSASFRSRLYAAHARTISAWRICVTESVACSAKTKSRNKLKREHRAQIALFPGVFMEILKVSSRDTPGR